MISCPAVPPVSPGSTGAASRGGCGRCAQRSRVRDDGLMVLERTPHAGGLATAGREARQMLAPVLRVVTRRDITVAAAELTYFAGIALVPWLLIACWTTTFVESVSAAQSRLVALQVLVPPQMGGRGPFVQLVEAGARLGPAGALLALLPASFYGEGIRRGCLSLVSYDDRLTGWRARLLMMPVLLATPLAIVVVHASGGLISLEQQGGTVAHVLRIVLGFTLCWLALTVPISWIFQKVAPGKVGWPAAFVGALATASFLAGFLQGFLLFLSIPVDLGLPFGGLQVVGGLVAVGLWLMVLHLVFLLGWVGTVALDERLREHRADSLER